MNFLDTALEYASREWPVFPLHDKEPLTSNGVKNATIDKTIIKEWAKRWPTANIGVACGQQSFICVDVDGPGAKAAIKSYAEEHGIESATEDLTTLAVHTRDERYHLYFSWTDGCERLRNWTNVIDGLDIRTEGGYAVLPPSIHPTTGKPYTWVNHPDECELKPMPKWLLDFLLESRKQKNYKKLEDIEQKAKLQRSRRSRDDYSAYAKRALDDEIAILRATHKGERNNQLNESAIKLFGLVKAGELDKTEVEGELRRAARSIGLDDDETEKTIISAWNGADKRDLPDPSTKENTLEILQDLPAKYKENYKILDEPEIQKALGDLLERDPLKFEILLKESEIRGAMKQALISTLTKPSQDDENDTTEPPDEEVNGLQFVDLVTVSNGKNGKKQFKFSPLKASKAILNKFPVVTTQGVRPKDPLTTWVYDDETGLFHANGEFRIKAATNRVAGDLFTLHMASETIAKVQYESIGDLDNLDSDPYIFPVANGVVDLRTGEVADYSPELKLTSKCPVKYDPNAECPIILNFLAESLADPLDIISAVDMFVAMGIRKAFDLFVILLGQGSNGKEVLETLIEAFFGSDQITAVRLEHLDKNQFSVGELIGKRALINSEVSGSAKQTDWMKRIASGDIMDTDVKNGSHVVFRPFCLQVLDCNNPPQFADGSHGLARRLLKLDFPYKFVDNPDKDNPHEKKKDEKLKKNIVADEELSGLLNLIIARAPDVIDSGTVFRRVRGTEALEQYTAQARNMESFVEECCELNIYDTELRITPAELYGAYKKYCERWNVSAKTETTFGSYITKQTKKSSVTTNGVRYRYCIDLKESYETDSKNRLEQVRTGSEQDKRYQEQVEQVKSTFFKDILKNILIGKRGHSIVESIGGDEKDKNGQKSPKPVPAIGLTRSEPVLTCSEPVSTCSTCSETKGKVVDGANTSKIEMPTPTKEGSSWRKLSGGKDLINGLEKFDGRLTAEDMINSFGWEPSKVKFTFDLLESQYGWTRDKLVSGLVVFKPPVGVV